MDNVEEKFKKADKIANELTGAQERLNKALGSIASDIEVIANNMAVEKIRQDNPDIDLSDIETAPDIAAARERLTGSIEDAIDAKTTVVVSSYKEAKTFFTE